MSDVLYFNGRFTTTEERLIGVEDRGLQFGDSIYEVFKFLNGAPLFLAEHYRRLTRSCAAIDLPVPWQWNDFAAIVRELLTRTTFPDGIVYVQLTRGEHPRKYLYDATLAPTVILYSRAFQFPDDRKKVLGIRAITFNDLRWGRCDVKSVNLLASVLAKREAERSGAAEAILVSDEIVREGASSSFFAVSSGRLITHPLDEHILPGVVRDQVIRLAIEARVRVDERPIRETELLEIDEAFITSTTQGVMPVGDINGRVIGNSRRGETTALLQELFDREEQCQAGG